MNGVRILGIDISVLYLALLAVAVVRGLRRTTGRRPAAASYNRTGRKWSVSSAQILRRLLAPLETFGHFANAKMRSSL
jgi:hypothetical protein